MSAMLPGPRSRTDGVRVFSRWPLQAIPPSSAAACILLIRSGSGITRATCSFPSVTSSVVPPRTSSRHLLRSAFNSPTPIRRSCMMVSSNPSRRPAGCPCRLVPVRFPILRLLVVCPRTRQPAEVSLDSATRSPSRWPRRAGRPDRPAGEPDRGLAPAAALGRGPSATSPCAGYGRTRSRGGPTARPWLTRQRAGRARRPGAAAGTRGSAPARPRCRSAAGARWPPARRSTARPVTASATSASRPIWRIPSSTLRVRATRPQKVRLCEPSILVRTRLTAAWVATRLSSGSEAAAVDVPTHMASALNPSSTPSALATILPRSRQ